MNALDHLEQALAELDQQGRLICAAHVSQAINQLRRELAVAKPKSELPVGFVSEEPKLT